VRLLQLRCCPAIYQQLKLGGAPDAAGRAAAAIDRTQAHPISGGSSSRRPWWANARQHLKQLPLQLLQLYARQHHVCVATAAAAAASLLLLLAQ
jgi:hypothetical protein